MSEQILERCDYTWQDGWGVHDCHLLKGHGHPKHRCACDAEWLKEEGDDASTDKG